MSSECGGGRTLGQFALVSYLPDPLASFLDRLRLELDPDCKPHAHVTILPPRPFRSEISEAVARLTEEGKTFPPFEITLGDVEIFPVSNVIYLGLATGQRSIRSLHDLMDVGTLYHRCPFDFHPHITIGQDLPPDKVQEAARIARERWAEWTGPRSFTVDALSFVQNVAPYVWLDVARVPLATPVGTL